MSQEAKYPGDGAKTTISLLVEQTLFASGDSGEITGADRFASIVLDLKARGIHNDSGGDTLTVTLDHSDDGESWETVDTAELDGDGSAHLDIDSPKATVRVTWTIAGNNPQPVVSADLTLTAPDAGEVHSELTTSAGLPALSITWPAGVDASDEDLTVDGFGKTTVPPETYLPDGFGFADWYGTDENGNLWQGFGLIYEGVVYNGVVFITKGNFEPGSYTTTRWVIADGYAITSTILSAPRTLHGEGEPQDPVSRKFRIYSPGKSGNSSGTFKLTFNEETTTAIAYDATATEIIAALEALESIGAGNIEQASGASDDTPNDTLHLVFVNDLGFKAVPGGFPSVTDDTTDNEIDTQNEGVGQGPDPAASDGDTYFDDTNGSSWLYNETAHYWVGPRMQTGMGGAIEIPNGIGTPVHFFDGSRTGWDLIDFTEPTMPKFKRGGLYAVTVEVLCNTLAEGLTFNAQLSTPDGPMDHYSAPAQTDGESVRTTVGRTFRAQAGDGFDLQVTHFDEADPTFLTVTTVVRIS